MTGLNKPLVAGFRLELDRIEIPGECRERCSGLPAGVLDPVRRALDRRWS